MPLESATETANRFEAGKEDADSMLGRGGKALVYVLHA